MIMSSCTAVPGWLSKGLDFKVQYTWDEEEKMWWKMFALVLPIVMTVQNLAKVLDVIRLNMMVAGYRKKLFWFKRCSAYNRRMTTMCSLAHYCFHNRNERKINMNYTNLVTLLLFAFVDLSVVAFIMYC